MTAKHVPLVSARDHRGELDRTQIEHCLSLTPTQRLDRHEGWRLFMKEAPASLRKSIPPHDPDAGA